ncbi:hypothetical protein GCM10011323_31120 [Pontibacter amylolyticus]|uniref:Uncharacterized protein n=1 Tax=Pontibacter amylolyticus TaxID=1424080 RepID=A0ABQ1WEK2_9BACT|nr:hypothetical protein GCM10011323_31120 [Pontibacter amylolyticus]
MLILDYILLSHLQISAALKYTTQGKNALDYKDIYFKYYTLQLTQTRSLTLFLSLL